MPIPSENSKLACQKDAEVLYKAMKGMGTKDSQIARIFGQRTPGQLQAIKREFNEMYDQTLEEMIKGDTSGDWEDLLLMSLIPTEERDAIRVNDAIDGVGTDDVYLRYLLTSKNWKAMRKMEAEYERLYEKSLLDDVKEDTSLNYENALYAVIRKAEYVALRLYRAIDRPGTDDQRLIRILTCKYCLSMFIFLYLMSPLSSCVVGA